MNDDRKDLPTVDSPNFLTRVREMLQTYKGSQGDPLKRGVMVGDLSEAGIIALRAGFLTNGGKNPIAGPGTALGSGSGVATEPDLTPPPTPTGFSASTSTTSIQILVGPITYTQGHGHAKTIVYAAKYLAGDPLPVFSSAVVVTEFTGDVFSFPVDPASLYRLWVKWVSVDGVESPPAGGTNGVIALAGLLDDVNIGNLNVSKIRSGSLSVGQYMQSANYVPATSGWRVNADGTAELANAVVRGAIYASSGTFTGTISASTVNSSTFNGNTYNGGTVNAATINNTTFNGGTVNATNFNGVNLNSGTLNIQGDGGSGWGYARSYGKWWGDGVNGWAFGREASTGSTLAEIKTGVSRLWMS